MKTYDEIKGFIDYTSKEEWKNYINNFVIPLWRVSWIIKGYFEELRVEFNNLPFSKVKEEDKPLLLGGLRPQDKIFTPNSLARFYLKFFGLRIKDLQLWILGQQNKELLGEVSVEVVETEFIRFVREIFNLLDNALQYQELVTNFGEPYFDYEELKRNPEKVKELIEEFYRALLNITLNYNYGTFFLCSINQISYKFMKAAYPRIDEALEFLKNEFGLIELEWNNPIPSEAGKMFKDYTLYCFPEYNPKKEGKSFGGAIVKLNEFIWKTFGHYSSKEIKETFSILFGEIPELKRELEKEIEQQLPEEYHRFIYFKGIMASENSYDIEESGKTIMELLDENMPWLFVNLVKIDSVYTDHLHFVSVG